MIHRANGFNTQCELSVRSTRKRGDTASVDGCVRGTTEQGDQI